MKKALAPLLIFLIGFGTPALSTWLYYRNPPSGQTNFGTLVGPAPVPEFMTLASGRKFRMSELDGKWVVAHVGDASCAGESCLRAMCLTRFLSLSRPNSEFRTERLFWAAGDGLPPGELSLGPGCGLGFGKLSSSSEPVDMIKDVHVVRFDAQLRAWLRDVTGAAPEGHVFLIDPQGNLMMKYASDADPYRMAKDFRRLLRLSRSIQ